MAEDTPLMWVLPLRTFDSASERMARLHIAKLQKHPDLDSIKVKDGKEEGIVELTVAFHPRLSAQEQQKVLDKIFRLPIRYRPRLSATRWERLRFQKTVLKDGDFGV